jgi:hypothetical protein
MWCNWAGPCKATQRYKICCKLQAQIQVRYPAVCISRNILRFPEKWVLYNSALTILRPTETLKLLPAFYVRKQREVWANEWVRGMILFLTFRSTFQIWYIFDLVFFVLFILKLVSQHRGMWNTFWIQFIFLFFFLYFTILLLHNLFSFASFGTDMLSATLALKFICKKQDQERNLRISL